MTTQARFLYLRCTPSKPVSKLVHLYTTPGEHYKAVMLLSSHTIGAGRRCRLKCSGSETGFSSQYNMLQLIQLI